MPPKKRIRKEDLPSSLAVLINSESPSSSNSGSHSRSHSQVREERRPQSRPPSRERGSENSRQEHEESQRAPRQTRQDQVTSSAHRYTQIPRITTGSAGLPISAILAETPSGQPSSRSRSSHQPYADNSRAPPPGQPEYPGYSGYSGPGYSGYPGHPEHPEDSVRSGDPVYSNPLHSTPPIRPHASDFTGAPFIAQPTPTPDRSYQPTQPRRAPIPSQQLGQQTANPSGRNPSERRLLPRQSHVEARADPPSEVHHAPGLQHGLVPSGRPAPPGRLFPVPDLRQGAAPMERKDPSQFRYADQVRIRREREEIAAKTTEEWNTLPPEVRMKQEASDREKRMQEDEERSREKEERNQEWRKNYEASRPPRSRRPRRREERSESRSRRLSEEDQDEEERRRSDRKSQKKEKSDKKKKPR